MDAARGGREGIEMLDQIIERSIAIARLEATIERFIRVDEARRQRRAVAVETS